MKPFNDEDLIAYHLHELAPRRARALEHALRTDPLLAAEFEAYAATLRAFKSDTPVAMDEKVLARNWNILRPSLVAHRTRPAVRFRWHLPALAGGGLALAGTVLIVATHHYNASRVPLTSSLREPTHMPQTTTSVENSLTARTPLTEQSGGTGRQEQVARPFSLSSNSDPQDAPHRRIAYLSLATEPAAAPQLIPLAPVPLPVLPAPPSVPVTMEPEAPLQASPSRRAQLKRGRSSVHHERVTDLTFSVDGTLIGTRAANNSGTEQYFQGATHAISAIAAFHQQLRPFIGYRLTASYTRPEFQYTLQTPTSTDSTVSVNSRVYEFAATYVVQGPHYRAFNTSAEAGAGFMGFIPTTASTATSYNARGAAVVGVAAEVALTKHLALHVAYRGQVFKGPDFKYTDYAGPVVTTTLFSNEPTVGITYRFSHK